MPYYNSVPKILYSLLNNRQPPPPTNTVMSGYPCLDALPTYNALLANNGTGQCVGCKLASTQYCEHSVCNKCPCFACRQFEFPEGRLEAKCGVCNTVQGLLPCTHCYRAICSDCANLHKVECVKDIEAKATTYQKTIADLHATEGEIDEYLKNLNTQLAAIKKAKMDAIEAIEKMYKEPLEDLESTIAKVNGLRRAQSVVSTTAQNVGNYVKTLVAKINNSRILPVGVLDHLDKILVYND